MGLFEDALKVAARVVLVQENIDGEEAARRLSVCMGCEFREEKNNRCGVCNCFLDLKTAAKTNWNARRLRNEITHCPTGKWGDVETANMYRQMDGKELLNT